MIDPALVDWTGACQNRTGRVAQQPFNRDPVRCSDGNGL